MSGPPRRGGQKGKKKEGKQLFQNKIKRAAFDMVEFKLNSPKIKPSKIPLKLPQFDTFGWANSKGYSLVVPGHFINLV